jgi:hypothetical protein
MKAFETTELNVNIKQARRCISKVIREFKWPILVDNPTNLVIQVPPPGGMMNMKYYLPIHIALTEELNCTRVDFSVDTKIGWSRIGNVGRYASGLVGQLRNAVEIEAMSYSDMANSTDELAKLAELYKNGYLEKEEYDAAKKKSLGIE